MKISIIVIFFSIFCCHSSSSLNNLDSLVIEGAIDRTDLYFNKIFNKNVGLVVNSSSYIKNTHLVDTLLEKKVNIVSIFSPEHGFKGNHEAGKKIGNNIYNGIPVFSLYGKTKKPSNLSLENIDVIIFDLQDVGVRFYTYISTLHYVMEACAENNITLIVLDRYNPHMNSVDGPILNVAFTSFVGMHPVPVIYGMTIGEYALMINSEGWLKDSLYCNLEVIPLSKGQITNNNNSFNSTKNFILKRPPSPNLKTTKSINLYPTLCFFEGTTISIGRGTDNPFELIGASFFNNKDFVNTLYLDKPIVNFTPRSRTESSNPKFINQQCVGIDCTFISNNILGKIEIGIIVDIYNISINKNITFFNSFFKKLSGNADLEKKISEGWSASQIKESWKMDLISFKKIREKYLIYSRK